MKFLSAAVPHPRKQGQKKPGSEINTLTAVALSLLAVAVAFIVGQAYLSRVALTLDERSSLLNTLLICDVMILGLSLVVTVLLWYLASVHYGGRDRRGLLSSKALVLYGILMILPIVFVASDLAFKPVAFARMDVEIALALSVIGIVAFAPYSIGALEHTRPRSMLTGLIEDLQKEFDAAGHEGTLDRVALQKPVLRGNTGMSLASLLEKLCRSGDQEPVAAALEEMKAIALFNTPQKSLKSIALASSMIALMAETAGISLKQGGHEVVYRVLDGLEDIAEASTHPGVSSLAFRSMGGVFDRCASAMDERAMGRLETKMMESYTSLYDRTGRHEALDLAAAMAEKAAKSRMFATEEYDGILYTSGAVYRRLAEADGSEELANRALTALFEASTARAAEASPIDHACIKGEIGRAYMALAKIKNAVKNYRSAASSFEEAGKMLEARVSPWDSALYRGKAAGAYTFLAGEYCRGRRYDDAIQAARSALALYPEAMKFFEKRSPEDYVEVVSNLGLAHTIVSEVYLKSRMFDQSLKNASLALDAYSSAAKTIDPRSMPERYAFMKTSIGQTHVTMAEIHFREKRYENAIGACDSAIAAYNEAIRIYDERKKDKPAAAVRKHLKKANDLFGTMMRIGVADRKPVPVAVEP